VRTVRLGHSTASVENGEWSSDVAALLPLVRSVDLRDDIEYIPDLDLALARKVARLFRGEVVDDTSAIGAMNVDY
jgi:hypothetical protein